MQKRLAELRLTVHSRLWSLLAVASLMASLLTLLLFGVIPSLLLCTVYCVVYSLFSFICYHPEATPLREKLNSYFQLLFIRAFGYIHGKSRTPPKPVQPSKACHREAQKMIQLIMRDFIDSWYGGVTSDLEFPDDVQKLLEHVSLETNTRLQTINLEELVTEIATLVIPYLEVVNESGLRKYNNVEVFDVNSEKCLRAFENSHIVTHRALYNRDYELKYYRQAIDALLQAAFPDKYQNCDLACMFVRELLLEKIFLPLFDLLTDPDFLLASIPLVLKKAPQDKCERELAQIKHENEELERKLSHGRLILKIKGSPLSQRRRFLTQSGRFSGSESTATMDAGRLPQRTASLSVSPKTRSTWAIIESDESPLTRSSMASLNTERVQIGVEPEASLATASLGDTAVSHGLWPQRSSTLTPGRESEEGETTWDVVETPTRGPIYFDRHVRVVTEAASSSHTAYIFKFPKRLLSEEELSSLGVGEGDTHLEAMKRYSQFDKFNSVLLKTPLAVHLKSISLPKKITFSKLVSKFSLTSRDDPVEIQERVQGLETYLQSVSAVSAIAESPDFHEFLISGIESLRQANIVKPQTKAAKRKSFLGIRGPSLPTFKEATQTAKRIPKRPVETVLSAYLDTNLPLPSQSLHTLHSLKPHPLPVERRGTLLASDSPSSSIGSVQLTPTIDSCLHGARRGSVKDSSCDGITAKSRIQSEELQTVGSTSSLSSSSCVSVSKEVPPVAVPMATTVQPTTKWGLFKQRLINFFRNAAMYLTMVYHMVLKGLHPLSSEGTAALAEEQARRVPLSNSLLALGAEASRRHCPELWACHESTQLAILVLAGGGMERYICKELRELAECEENWARALFHLRHTFWPGGKFMTGSTTRKSEEERKEMRKEAVKAIKKFLPNFLPPVVGAADYDNAVNHVLDCLQNPKVTRYFLLRLIDVVLIKLVPELNQSEFQSRLAKLRTMSPPPRNRLATRTP